MSDRLDAFLSHRGFGSRSQVRGLIRSGRVTVAGEGCRDQAAHLRGAEVRVDGEPVAGGVTGPRGGGGGEAGRPPQRRARPAPGPRPGRPPRDPRRWAGAVAARGPAYLSAPRRGWGPTRFPRT